jgi:hypothetical protein
MRANFYENSNFGIFVVFFGGDSIQGAAVPPAHADVFAYITAT